jgi:putative transposase
MPAKDQPIKEAIAAIAGKSRRGRKKIIKRLQRKHPEWKSGRIRRIYEQSGFALTKNLKRRRINNPANPIAITTQPHEEWGIDFMSDALMNGRKIRMLNMIDHYSRMCLAIAVAHNFPARRVIEYLERMIEKYGKPQRIRTDNGPEFISKLFQKWLKDKGIEWCKIPRGRPDQNSLVERFNRSYREEILDTHLFYTIQDAQRRTDLWVNEYNHEWDHESLNFKTPAEYAAA